MNRSFSFALEHDAASSRAVTILSHVYQAAGWRVYTQTFPSHSLQPGYVTQGLIADRPIASPYQPLDMVVLSSPEALYEWQPLASPNAVILAENATAASKQTLVSQSVAAIARAVTKDPAMAEYVSVGAILAMTGYSIKEIPGYIAINDRQQQAILAGINCVRSLKPFKLISPRNAPDNGMVLTGNQATVGAIIAGGSRYIAWQRGVAKEAYTMLNQQMEQTLYCQAADTAVTTIAAATGAAVAGTRAVAVIDVSHSSSTTAILEAVYAEVPLVVIAISSSGSWDSASQLIQGSGESPVIVSPANPQECWSYLTQATNLAEVYQTPVVVLLDQAILRQVMSVDDISGQRIKIDRGKLVRTSRAVQATSYQRYAPQPDGISPRKLPGQTGAVFCTFGNRDSQAINKRYQKVHGLSSEILPYITYGPAISDVTIICSGVVVTPVRAALSLLESCGIKASALQISCISPWPSQAINSLIRKGKYAVVVDDNQGTLTTLVTMQSGVAIRHTVQLAPGPLAADELAQTFIDLFGPHGETK
jgi:pyruvate/2-oxoacid:ferredoxin oxidoreductase alpha subunit